MSASRSAASLSLGQIDCSTRMFLVGLCLDDGDLAGLGLLPRAADLSVRRRVAACSALHRLLAAEAGLQARVADLLDLRHLERVCAVRASAATQLETELVQAAERADGCALAGWAWALLTDPRPEVFALGRRWMSECFVRGTRLLAAAPSPCA